MVSPLGLQGCLVERICGVHVLPQPHLKPTFNNKPCQPEDAPALLFCYWKAAGNWCGSSSTASPQDVLPQLAGSAARFCVLLLLMTRISCARIALQYVASFSGRPISQASQCHEGLGRRPAAPRPRDVRCASASVAAHPRQLLQSWPATVGEPAALSRF